MLAVYTWSRRPPAAMSILNERYFHTKPVHNCRYLDVDIKRCPAGCNIGIPRASRPGGKMGPTLICSVPRRPASSKIRRCAPAAPTCTRKNKSAGIDVEIHVEMERGLFCFGEKISFLFFNSLFSRHHLAMNRAIRANLNYEVIYIPRVAYHATS